MSVGGQYDVLKVKRPDADDRCGMRDYLYLWHDPEKRCVVASGLQFADVVQKLAGTDSGVVMLTHQHEDSRRDQSTGLDYVSSAEFSEVCRQDIYGWGDFCWADFAGKSFPHLAKESVAELLYFNHAKEPLRDVSIPGLGNQYLAAAHDDGWRLIFYYAHWDVITALLASLPLPTHIQGQPVLENRAHAVWIDKSGIFPEEPTWDIDKVMSRRCGASSPKHTIESIDS